MTLLLLLSHKEKVRENNSFPSLSPSSSPHSFTILFRCRWLSEKPKHFSFGVSTLLQDSHHVYQYTHRKNKITTGTSKSTTMPTPDTSSTLRYTGQILHKSSLHGCLSSGFILVDRWAKVPISDKPGTPFIHSYTVDLGSTRPYQCHWPEIKVGKRIGCTTLW